MDLKKCRLLVTPTSYGKNDPRLKTELEAVVGEVIYASTGKPLSSADLARLLPGIDGYIAGLDTIDKEALSTADKLQVIARYGVGYDNVDLAVARTKNIVVTNTPGANAASVAELALGLMLALARQIPTAAEAVRQGKYPRLNGVSLEGKTIGIVGLGSIGKKLALRLAGFECRIISFDPYADQKFACEHNISLVSLDELLPEADFLSLHLPLISETKGFVNKEFLSKVKKGAFLVNTARGEIIDEEALLEALENGTIRGVAMDAFAQEPVDPKNPLLFMSQVIGTPHLGAQTDGATNTMGWMAFEECLAVLSGKEPQYRIV